MISEKKYLRHNKNNTSSLFHSLFKNFKKLKSILIKYYSILPVLFSFFISLNTTNVPNTTEKNYSIKYKFLLKFLSF